MTPVAWRPPFFGGISRSIEPFLTRSASPLCLQPELMLLRCVLQRSQKRRDVALEVLRAQSCTKNLFQGLQAKAASTVASMNRHIFLPHICMQVGGVVHHSEPDVASLKMLYSNLMHLEAFHSESENTADPYGPRTATLRSTVVRLSASSWIGCNTRAHPILQPTLTSEIS